MKWNLLNTNTNCDSQYTYIIDKITTTWKTLINQMNFLKSKNLSLILNDFWYLIIKNWDINKSILLKKTCRLKANSIREHLTWKNQTKIYKSENLFFDSIFETYFERCRQFNFTILRNRWYNKYFELNDYYKNKRETLKKTKRVMIEMSFFIDEKINETNNNVKIIKIAINCWFMSI